MNTPTDHPVFVAIDGEYGDAKDIRIFEYGQLTEEQWDFIATIDTDYDRYQYVVAVIDNDISALARMNEEWGI